MIDGAFLKGTLEMPVNAAQEAAQQFAWGSLLPNRILCCVAIILVLITIVDTLNIFPDLASCIGRWRPCLIIEHSLSLARLRNQAAAAFSLSLCLLADRFALYRPGFFRVLPQGWSAAGVIAVFCVWLLLRKSMFKVLRFGYIPSDQKNAIHCTLFTFLILAGIVMLPVAGMMSLSGIPENVIRIVLWSIFGINWLISLVRTGQIIADCHSGLPTFLYLCALEILPAGLVAASALLL